MSSLRSKKQNDNRYDQAELGTRGIYLVDNELEILREALREHVSALAIDIGPRTPANGNSLALAADYIHSVFEEDRPLRDKTGLPIL